MIELVRGVRYDLGGVRDMLREDAQVAGLPLYVEIMHLNGQKGFRNRTLASSQTLLEQQVPFHLYGSPVISSL